MENYLYKEILMALNGSEKKALLKKKGGWGDINTGTGYGKVAVSYSLQAITNTKFP